MKSKSNCNLNSTSPPPETVSQPSKPTNPPVGTTASSRKNKKAWRKNVNLSSIETGLQEFRTQQRLGDGKIIVEKASEALYFTDKSGDDKTKKSIACRKLTIDEILTPKSAFAGIRSRLPPSSTIVVNERSKVRKVSKSVSHQITLLAEKKKRMGAVIGTFQNMKKQIKKSKQQKLKNALGGYNLWDDNVSQNEISIVDLDQNETNFLKPGKEIMLKKPVLPVQTKIHDPAVDVIHAGASYRPTFNDHQSLLALALKHEQDKISFKEALDKKLSYPKELDDLNDEDFFNDDEENVEQETEDSNSSQEIPDIPAAVSNIRRKTKLEKNKELKRALIEKESSKLKQQKKIIKQINTIKDIEKSIIKDESVEKKKKIEKTKLGPYEFRPNVLEIQLTEELTDSLRTLKPEGNMFKDRFLSLQKRQLIEPRVPVSRKRRYKLKETESHDYKRFK